MPASPQHEFHVPGAYLFDNPPPTAFPPARPLGANVFLPPADSVYGLGGPGADLARSVGSLYSEVAGGGQSYENGGAKRKRAAQDSRESTPAALAETTAEWGTYTLAGQIDVAGVASTTNGLDESVYSDVGYRRALGPTREEEAGEAGEAGVANTSADADRWTVLHALGNVVGKVWEFCTTGAFRGFHAGGGAGYDWATGKPEGADLAVRADSKEDTDDATDLERSSTPTPQRNGKRRQVSMGTGDEVGRNWVMVDARQKRPTARATPTYTRAASASTVTPGTAASRRIHTPISRLGATPTTQKRTQTGTQTRTPTRTQTRTLTRRTSASTATARVSHAGSPLLSSREPASFASPRSSTPVAAVNASPRRTFGSTGINSRLPMPLSGADANPFARAGAASPRPGSRAGGRASSIAVGRPSSPAVSTSPGHRRSHSGRVGVSPFPKKATYMEADNDVLDMADSPRLTDEAKRLAAQNRAADEESDAQIEAFNVRLQQMIRQGQEALGTTFEVDGDDDEGEDYWGED